MPRPAARSAARCRVKKAAKPISVDAEQLRAQHLLRSQADRPQRRLTVETPVQTFQTPLIAPTVTALAGVSDGEGGYFLEGIVNSNNTKVTTCTFEYGTTATYPNTYEAPCLPSPSGPDEVQLINVEATEGQFKLSFRGQTTADLPFNATPAEVQTALRALSQIGPDRRRRHRLRRRPTWSPSPARSPAPTSSRSRPATAPRRWAVAAESASRPKPKAASTTRSPSKPTSKRSPRRHLPLPHLRHQRRRHSLHRRSRTSFPPSRKKDRPAPTKRSATKTAPSPCPNAAPTRWSRPPARKALAQSLETYDGGDRVAYNVGSRRTSPNPAKARIVNYYVAARTAAGWETIPDLNGSSGSLRRRPDQCRFQLYKTALPRLTRQISAPRSGGCTGKVTPVTSKRPYAYLRNPDGTFALIGSIETGASSLRQCHRRASADLSHVVTWGGGSSSEWGPGVYEFVGTGMAQPRRVDVDNSGAPISTCVGSR